MERYELKIDKTLYELFQNEFELFPNSSVYGQLECILASNENSCQFITKLLKCHKLIDNLDSVDLAFKERGVHSVCVLLLGLVVKDFNKLFSELANILNCDISLENSEPYINYWLWLITSICHDYGYFSKHIKEPVSLKCLYLKYNLFDDVPFFNIKSVEDYANKYPKTLKNNYKQIQNYFEYSKEYYSKQKESKEKCDHGILGAVLLFNELMDTCNKFPPNNPNNDSDVRYSMHLMNREDLEHDVLYYKTACLTIAQHNIFKSDSEHWDHIYRKFDLLYLTSQSNYKVGVDTPLLALLALVDSLDFIKKFVASETLKWETKTITLLKSVRMLVTTDKILIDFSELKSLVNTCEFNKYINSIKKLNEWTDFVVKEKNNIIEIMRRS